MNSIKSIVKAILNESNEKVITKILNIINVYGEFNINDIKERGVELISVNPTVFVHIEYFYKDGVIAVSYDVEDETLEDEYDMTYDELDSGTLDHIYRLALIWKDIKQGY